MRSFNDAGYAGSCYNPNVIRAHAQDLAKVIPLLMDIFQADFIAVTGKSGISMAYATLMLLDFPLVVVRKAGENSHGASIEGDDRIACRPQTGRYLVLDDFVASGSTLSQIHDKLAMYQMDDASSGIAPLECVGCIAYGRLHNCRDNWAGFTVGSKKVPEINVKGIEEPTRDSLLYQTHKFYRSNI